MKRLPLAFGLALGLSPMAPALAGETVTVYKSPSCGCCTDWVKHMEDNGFDVEAINTQRINQIKAEAGLPQGLASCHTAFVGDYVIEGHVPASDVQRLLAEAPAARGLAVPGMPVGSPGMEMGDRQDDYTVILFNEAGQTQPFAHHP
ncbi:DUF411 domain-containing protein [Marinobacter zhejiangensis]|uniref:Uncharacterized conserved protein n=1 Tax=Marinobacter zhejiangensis TaxID=488535 RepID=A0A1I4LG90_9GAMM|nr:DUF411 domain-containing protein [Marinobacter zhejiangensis]SFL89921.1 Uncharacterized conserved protein [Marinobacter zhejiangensis]